MQLYHKVSIDVDKTSHSYAGSIVNIWNVQQGTISCASLMWTKRYIQEQLLYISGWPGMPHLALKFPQLCLSCLTLAHAGQCRRNLQGSEDFPFVCSARLRSFPMTMQHVVCVGFIMCTSLFQSGFAPCGTLPESKSVMIAHNFRGISCRHPVIAVHAASIPFCKIDISRTLVCRPMPYPRSNRVRKMILTNHIQKQLLMYETAISFVRCNLGVTLGP